MNIKLELERELEP